MEPLAFYSSPDDIHQIFPSDDGAQCLPFSTSACNASSLIAIGDESGAVRLVETAKDEDPGFAIPYLTFQCHDNAIFDLCWSPDDKLLATASGDQTCRIFDVMKQRTLSSLQHHQNSVKQIYFNAANPSILCSSSRDGNLNVWDLRVAGPMMSDGPNIVTVLSPVLSVLGAHKSNRKSNSVTAAVWLDDHRIATACEHNAVIKVWDLRTSQVRRKSPIPVETSALPPHHALPAHRNFGVNSLSVSPDGQRVYAVCKDSNVYAYATHHLQNGPMHAYSHPRLHAETFYVKGGISRDGKFVATGSSDGVACLFPTEERYLDKRISDTFVNNSHPLALAKYLQVGRGVALVRGHDREVTDVTWTVGGDLVTVSDNYTARCWRQGERGVEAENMRAGGEEGGRRWLWGWADRKGDAESGGKI
ncbi:putative cell division cycle protein cdt2 [Sphaerosporella brunnea]|uniref:Putative cell division cycle protein cdt2 n=1 Tax=Sphaerosporella brunnea TaxID=1250544 RepID=A0A5J5FC65_9PEZI|nr:putative cell division cycle protein cdt2 [Sphaerosporella brunnea]